nr:MAG TPA: hypothetical protein [Caudoviricetes sp.]
MSKNKPPRVASSGRFLVIQSVNQWRNYTNEQ